MDYVTVNIVRDICGDINFEWKHAVKKNTEVLLVASGIEVGLEVNAKHDRQWTYNVTMGRVRATIVAVQKQ